MNTISRRAASALGLLTLSMLVAGCSGGPSVKPEAPEGVDLAGSWRLDSKSSQDPQVLIAEIQQKAVERMRGRRDDRDYESGPMGYPAGSGPEGGSARDPDVSARQSSFDIRRGPGSFIRSRYVAALGARLTGDSLTIEQSPARFVIVRTESQRSYIPGGRSVVSVADGVADQVSGWKGREYVIDVRPQVGPRLTERYGLTADGKLVEKILLTGDDLPKLEFTRIYERGVAPERQRPTSN